MSKTRTPPPLQPRGWEKSETHMDVALTDTEHLLWRTVFGDRRMADQVRQIVNQQAYRMAGIPEDQISKEFVTAPGMERRVAKEIQRHYKVMKQLMAKGQHE